MMRPSDPARPVVPTSPHRREERREPSGVHRRQSLPDPEAFYVRAHRRGGYCVMIDGRATPISTHYDARSAMMLAEILAKKVNAKVVVET